MKEKLLKMLKCQKELDKKIMEVKGFTFSHAAIHLALLAEIGELLNERPDIFKYWKSQFTIDHDKAKEELADVWSFALSKSIHIALEMEEELDDIAEETMRWYERYDSWYKTNGLNVEVNVSSLVDSIFECSELGHLIALGKVLGYSFDDAYAAYLKKKAINYERLESGY